MFGEGGHRHVVWLPFDLFLKLSGFSLTSVRRGPTASPSETGAFIGAFHFLGTGSVSPQLGVCALLNKRRNAEAYVRHSFLERIRGPDHRNTTLRVSCHRCVREITTYVIPSRKFGSPAPTKTVQKFCGTLCQNVTRSEIVGDGFTFVVCVSQIGINTIKSLHLVDSATVYSELSTPRHGCSFFHSRNATLQGSSGIIPGIPRCSR